MIGYSGDWKDNMGGKNIWKALKNKGDGMQRIWKKSVNSWDKL